jgi:predicted PhzF superfamily epimerase YddE/YHI9
LHSFKLPSNGTSTYVVSQGVEMRRPALLIGKVKVDSQESVTCLVGGTSIKVGEGWIAVPPLEV